MSNGKGYTPRPFSVDQKTYETNWANTFKQTSDRLLSLSEKYALHAEYVQQVESGMFWEMHPELTGTWEVDKEQWYAKIGA